MQIVPDTDRSALLRAISVKPPTEEQKQKGWTRDWSVAWAEHDVLLSGGHPATEDQKRKGWTQNWDAWRSREDLVLPNGSVIEFLDFTGGATIIAAREAARDDEFAAARKAAEEAEAVLRQLTLEEALAKKEQVFEPAEILTGTLNTGAKVPLIGLGTWKAKPGEVKAAVLHALRHGGYRHIDCASVYENETEVGEALTEIFERTRLTRDKVFICSKLWNNDHAPSEKVEAAVRKSLAALKLDYLDLYLIHWPVVTGCRGPELKPSIVDTWRAMESLVEKGLVRAIGVSNFSIKKMETIIASKPKVPLSVCQVEVHPYWRQEKIQAWCLERGIHLTAFSPLGSPDSASIFARTGPPLLENETVREIGKKYGRNVGQVLIKWALQQRPGCSVLPKSTSPERIKANADMLGWELTADDVAVINGFAHQQRMVHGSMWLQKEGPYRTMEELWDEPELA